MANEVAAAGADAFLAWSPVSMGYLHGLFESGHERFMAMAVRHTGEVRLICPALTATQAGRCGVADIRPWKDGEDPLVHFRELAADWGLRSAIVAVDDELPAQMLLAMQTELPAALFKPGSAILSNLMRVKDADELDAMRRAARIADAAYPAALAALRPGMTEVQLEGVLRSEMLRLGGKPTFAIVAAGALGAEPHHHSDETAIRAGDVVILDFGCEVEGYQSDITRVAACGKAPEEAHRVYEIVLASHRAGRAAARPGATCGSVDAASRRVIEEAGYGEAFFHRTGHGIGMRGHEEPYIVAGSEVALEPGHCFSVEPGIYLAGRFGVRIENIVTVTADGCESLNEEPADRLVEVG